jgi:hypothetical protein
LDILRTISARVDWHGLCRDQLLKRIEASKFVDIYDADGSGSRMSNCAPPRG